MEAIYDSSRGRCRGLLLYDSAAIEFMSVNSRSASRRRQITLDLALGRLMPAAGLSVWLRSSDAGRKRVAD